MKLRIQGNLLRLRLTQKDVACLHDHQLVECAIHFPSGRELRYSLASSSDAPEISADFENDLIRILVPHAVATAWAESSEVAIEGCGDSSVQVLIEKDFQCLHNASGPGPDPDAYPHPLTMVKERSAA
jgi:hypothetical protein